MHLMATTLPPYISQIAGAPRRNDCGPACALMLARWVGRGLSDSVTTWADRIDSPHDGTTAADLAGMLRVLGLTPLVGMATQLPRIELVHYDRLPKQNPAFAGGTFLHWIVRLSETTYHDPLWTGTQGASLSATKAQLDAANAGATNSVGMVERPQTHMSEPARIPYERVYRVIPAGATEEEAVAIFRDAFRNNRQTVGSSYDDAGIGDGLKSKRAILYGIPADQRAAFTAFFAQWYPSTTVEFFGETKPPATPTTPSQPAPVAATPAAILGVHELGQAGMAREALQRGAGAVMVFEDALGAAQMSVAFPDRIVMHRKYFKYAFSPAEILAQHGIDPNGVSASRAWYRGLNENDVDGFDSSPDGIRKRAAWDIECAKLLKRAAPNARWVAGGWAHGNPDFTNQAVCDAMRDGYAAAYNAGLILFDLHNYSKSDPNNPKNFRFYAPVWFERRWQFLFEKCGFDPKVRGIVASEAGIEAGAGGFRWAGFTPAEFAAWCAYALKVQTQPLVIAGVSYPSPFLCGTIFQWGNNYSGSGGWYGYGLDEYISTLESAWAGQLPAEKSLAGVELSEGAQPPVDYAPPAKNFDHFLT